MVIKDKRKKALHPFFAIAMVGLFVWISANIVGWVADPVEEAEMEFRVYCEGVELFETSDGSFGWPDYNDDYDPHCIDLATESE